MKIAIIGSRGLVVEDFDAYLPPHCTEIISGGARGIDACARAYAEKKASYVPRYCPIIGGLEGARRFVATKRS